MTSEPAEHPVRPVQRTRCCCLEAHFTEREVDLLCLLAAGASTESAASELSVSPHTVAHHLGQMLRRVDAHNRTELVARAYSAGVLVPGSWPPGASGRRCVETGGP